MGVGAGKTFCAALLCALRLVEGKRIVCLSQTSRQSREVMWVEIIKQLDNIVPGQYKAKEGAQKITFGKTGVIYFASYESLETLRGFTQIALAVCDEVCLAPSDLFSVVSL